ncbi:MAG TPA: hypothetical protein VJC01_02330 [Candidatus Paceibacterota bacterium]
MFQKITNSVIALTLTLGVCIIAFNSDSGFELIGIGVVFGLGLVSCLVEWDSVVCKCERGRISAASSFVIAVGFTVCIISVGLLKTVLIGWLILILILVISAVIM